MKKAILCVCMYLVTIITGKPVAAEGFLPTTTQDGVSNYIRHIYSQIDFSGKQPINYDVFETAYRGYMNLRSAGKLNTEKQILTICDLTLSSAEDRMWIIDLATKKVVFNTYVAHGQGSGEEFATEFSNNQDSHQTSLGFYVTGETYIGEHGTSLRLSGMDQGFNNNAFDRGIVVHGADYVCDKFISYNQRIGRSWGCPAVPSKLSGKIINEIKDGTCLFIYYPKKNYLQASYWINKKPEYLPENNLFDNFRKPLAGDTIIQYVSATGKLDSVRHAMH